VTGGARNVTGGTVDITGGAVDITGGAVDVTGGAVDEACDTGMVTGTRPCRRFDFCPWFDTSSGRQHDTSS